MAHKSITHILSVIFVLAVPSIPASAQAAPLELVSHNEEAAGEFGISVSGVPDVNGDGRADVVVGARGESPGASPDHAGRAYLFDGVTGSLLRTLTSPSEESFGQFGGSVSGIPDVNGDGRGDVVIGAHLEPTSVNPAEAGRVYIFNGATGALLRTLISPNEEASGQFGISVSGIDDVNGDGRGDIVVGANHEDPGASPAGAGRAYIISGATGSLLQTLASPNEEDSGQFGFSVSGVPDVTGDGRGDVVIGTRGEDPGASPAGAGRAYIFNGSTGALIHTLTSPNEESGGSFGYSVSGAPDVNGDGRGEVVIGAFGESPGASPDDAGRAYIFNGATGALLRTLASPNEALDAEFGGSVSGAPDVDGDGLGDAIIGIRLSPGFARSPYPGNAHIFSGATGAFVRTLDSPNSEEDGFFGNAVSGISDIDGDGLGEFIIGAYREGPGASPVNAGRAYIFQSSGGPLEVRDWSLY